jgi:acyloxyacyl hydrolase
LDSATGKAWEDEFCNDTQRLGIAVLGDSISAHFHIPEQWLDAKEFSIAAFEHLGFILENELDWPEMSASTGHVNISWPNIEGEEKVFL